MVFTNVNRPSAVDVLRPFTVGDTFYADTTSTLAKRAIGTTDQVYIVTGGVPVWSSAVNLTALTVIDSGFAIVGSADATKRLMFEVDGQTANDTLTISAGAQTNSRTLSVPVLAGADTIATLAVANAFTGNNTMAGTLELTTASNGLTISKTTGTTLTVSSTQDSASKDTGSIVTEGGLGVEKAIVAGTTIIAGSNITATGSAGGGLIAGTGTGAKGVIINGAAGNSRFMNFKSNYSDRWFVQCDGTAEAGADAGSNFSFTAYNDAGAFIDSPMAITRAAGGPVSFTRHMILPAATTSIPSIRLPHGTAPSSPTNGDMWTTTAGLFVRINGATVGPLS